MSHRDSEAGARHLGACTVAHASPVGANPRHPTGELEGRLSTCAHAERLRCPDGACAACEAFGHGPHSLAEIAAHFGLTRERVRQIETKALAKLARRFPRLAAELVATREARTMAPRVDDTDD